MPVSKSISSTVSWKDTRTLVWLGGWLRLDGSWQLQNMINTLSHSPQNSWMGRLNMVTFFGTEENLETVAQGKQIKNTWWNLVFVSSNSIRMLSGIFVNPWSFRSNARRHKNCISAGYPSYKMLLEASSVVSSPDKHPSDWSCDFICFQWASVNTPLLCCWENNMLNQYGETSPIIWPFDASQVDWSCFKYIIKLGKIIKNLTSQKSARTNFHLHKSIESQTGNVSMDPDRSGIAPWATMLCFPQPALEIWRLWDCLLDQLCMFFWG